MRGRSAIGISRAPPWAGVPPERRDFVRMTTVVDESRRCGRQTRLAPSAASTVVEEEAACDHETSTDDRASTLLSSAAPPCVPRTRHRDQGGTTGDPPVRHSGAVERRCVSNGGLCRADHRSFMDAGRRIIFAEPLSVLASRQCSTDGRFLSKHRSLSLERAPRSREPRHRFVLHTTTVVDSRPRFLEATTAVEDDGRVSRQACRRGR